MRKGHFGIFAAIVGNRTDSYRGVKKKLNKISANRLFASFVAGDFGKSSEDAHKAMVKVKVGVLCGALPTGGTGGAPWERPLSTGPQFRLVYSKSQIGNKI